MAAGTWFVVCLLLLDICSLVAAFLTRLWGLWGTHKRRERRDRERDYILACVRVVCVGRVRLCGEDAHAGQ